MKNSYATKFYAPFDSQHNKSQAIALAQTVLRATYCPKGEIKLNPNFRYVDDKGSTPVVKTASVAKPWGSPPFDLRWIVQFTCSEWREVK